MQKIQKNDGDSSTNLYYIKMTTEFFQEHKKEVTGMKKNKVKYSIELGLGEYR
jgi:hypothetical protein